MSKLVNWFYIFFFWDSKTIWRRSRGRSTSCWKLKLSRWETTWWSTWCLRSPKPYRNAPRSNRTTQSAFWYDGLLLWYGLRPASVGARCTLFRHCEQPRFIFLARLSIFFGWTKIDWASRFNTRWECTDRSQGIGDGKGPNILITFFVSLFNDLDHLFESSVKLRSGRTTESTKPHMNRLRTCQYRKAWAEIPNPKPSPLYINP